MKIQVPINVLAALLPCLASIADGGEVLEVEVSAGSHPRRDAPVSMKVPDGTRSATLIEVTGGRERPAPVQIEPGAPGSPAKARWILDGATEAGKSRRFRLTTSLAPAGGERLPGSGGALALKDVPGKHLEVLIDGRSILRYNYGKVPPPDPSIPAIQTRNGYLHPLWSPSGQVLTMDYPRNHLHHRGVWFPWTKTEFEGRHPDFWNLGDGTGTVEYEALEERYEGPVFAGFRSRQVHLDLKAPGGPRPALRERWDVRAYAVGGAKAGYFIFDLESTQECAGGSPLRLEQYRYGGLGLRGSTEWEGERVRVFTSEGKGRLNGEDTTARWCDLSGPVGGAWAGVTILGSPENFRAPQSLRVHPSEPFINFSPVKSGEFSIEPGKTYVSRYRFYLHDDVLRADEADRIWIDYADPPSVQSVR